jgi:hypothetical protein
MAVKVYANMLDTSACLLAADGQNQNSAAVWFLVLFTLFVGIDSVVNALALGRTLKVWRSVDTNDTKVEPESVIKGNVIAATRIT